MSWLNHPKFAPVRDDTLKQFRAKEFDFRKVKSVIFLCGGLESPRRDRVAQYLRKNRTDALLFYADDVWPAIADQPGLNALEMEAELARLADIVLIIVESPGTFAELGAFSLSDRLREKILPIIDKQHRDAGSFINTGPVRWIDQDSLFGPTLWVDHSTILQIGDELEERLDRLPKPRRARIPDLNASPKHLLFFICDLISVFGPSPIEHLEYYVEQVLGQAPNSNVASLIGLAKAMGLVDVVTDPFGSDMYYRPLHDHRLQSFQYKKYLNLPCLRAQIIGVLFSIDRARAVLELTGSNV